MTPCRRLRRKEASKYLLDIWGISRKPSTLSKLATIGGGPAFQKDGNIPLYTEPGLDDFARATLTAPVTSTSELAAAKAAANAQAGT